MYTEIKFTPIPNCLQHFHFCDLLLYSAYPELHLPIFTAFQIKEFVIVVVVTVPVPLKTAVTG